MKKSISAFLAIVICLTTLASYAVAAESSQPLPSAFFDDLIEETNNKVLGTWSAPIIKSTGARAHTSSIVVQPTPERFTFTVKHTGVSAKYFYKILVNGSVKKTGAKQVFAGVTTWEVDYPLETITETYTVEITSIDVRGDKGSGRITSLSRFVPVNYVRMWAPGTFGASEDSLLYHFTKHHKRVAISNIYTYTVVADSFRGQFFSTREGKSVKGYTPNTFKYTSGLRYVEVAGDNPRYGKIVSFGSVI